MVLICNEKGTATKNDDDKNEQAQFECRLKGLSQNH